MSYMDPIWGHAKNTGFRFREPHAAGSSACAPLTLRRLLPAVEYCSTLSDSAKVLTSGDSKLVGLEATLDHQNISVPKMELRILTYVGVSKN